MTEHGSTVTFGGRQRFVPRVRRRGYLGVRGKLVALRCHVWERQLPKIFTLTEFEPAGLRFEAADAFELRSIVNLGAERLFLRAMLDALRPDDVLYDIGANIGLVALHAARKCRTVAFEPDPHFLARLRRNAELNPSVAPDVMGIAIGDRDGTAPLFNDGVGEKSPSLVRQRGEPAASTVETRTLGSVVARGDIPAPTVLKLDIEGAEILAVRGAASILSGPSPPRALFLELHDSFLPAFDSSTDEVLELVGEAGYRILLYEAQRADQRHVILERG